MQGHYVPGILTIFLRINEDSPLTSFIPEFKLRPKAKNTSGTTWFRDTCTGHTSCLALVSLISFHAVKNRTLRMILPKTCFVFLFEKITTSALLAMDLFTTLFITLSFFVIKNGNCFKELLPIISNGIKEYFTFFRWISLSDNKELLYLYFLIFLS